MKDVHPTLQVYLAGPDVFMPNAVALGLAKKQCVEAVGCIAHFPLDPEITDFKPTPQTAFTIAVENEALMAKSQVILANMTPWHGPSMDVGTSFELGYMSAKADYCSEKILIIGYYEGEWELDFAKRVASMVYNEDVLTLPDGRITDQQGITLEHFTLSENLMVVGAIEKTGGAIFPGFQQAVANIQSLWSKKA